MSESRLEAYLKAKNISDEVIEQYDNELIIGTGATHIDPETIDENLKNWMIPGGAAVMQYMESSDDSSEDKTDDTNEDTAEEDTTDDTDPSTVEPETDDTINVSGAVTDPDAISNLSSDDAANTTVNATTNDAVEAVSDSGNYFDNINIEG